MLHRFGNVGIEAGLKPETPCHIVNIVNEIIEWPIAHIDAFAADGLIFLLLTQLPFVIFMAPLKLDPVVIFTIISSIFYSIYS